jgi:ABC-type antimicrobial peptide transport system permease subunit
VAIGIGLSSTLVPAFRASRMSIADALRYVG